MPKKCCASVLSVSGFFSSSWVGRVLNRALGGEWESEMETLSDNRAGESLRDGCNRRNRGLVGHAAFLEVLRSCNQATSWLTWQRDACSIAVDKELRSINQNHFREFAWQYLYVLTFCFLDCLQPPFC
ncbi:hypothetical protein CAOG_010130 [Capsaspora owczarzaki ATCC 30864]|uniref:Uncharacterized protein n=1 Tax=Capsaspora owczarzaki (strain ATCC 30864) TaxID=595528 RepID=A0A0D2WWR6_CAPO3|nr:hypothetical protein CAOG_010130 [Capsaspora owczarzaki ATCC 30864]